MRPGRVGEVQLGAAIKIAVLGWGSLIWDVRPEFDSHLHLWTAGGPFLPLEFSRISKSRGNALTLVIDSALGAPVETLFALSKKTALQAVLDDLDRKQTTAANIGHIDLVNGRPTRTR